MASRTIEQLLPVKHEDVEPMYSKEEVLNKLASAVKFYRDPDPQGRLKSEVQLQQQLELEIMYSIAKAML